MLRRVPELGFEFSVFLEEERGHDLSLEGLNCCHRGEPLEPADAGLEIRCHRDELHVGGAFEVGRKLHGVQSLHLDLKFVDEEIGDAFLLLEKKDARRDLLSDRWVLCERRAWGLGLEGVL